MASTRRIEMPDAEPRQREGRAHDRYPLEMDVVVMLVSEGDSVSAALRNVSYGGLSLEAADNAVPLGAAVEVTLPLEPGVSLKLTGVVCWRRGSEVGVRYEGLRRAARLTVQALVEEAKRHDDAVTRTG